MDLSVIKERIKIIEELEVENKKANELLKSALENDEIYRKVAEEAKAINSKKKELKDSIMAREGNIKLVEDIRENMDEIKTLKEILAVELIDFHEKNKTDMIDDANGESRKFKFSVKLLPPGVKGYDRDDIGRYAGEEKK
jgi:hypothetical protein